MRFSVVILLFLATRLAAQVELPDLRAQNAGGTVVEIHDVKLLHVDPDGIRVLHSAGSAKIAYELLPDDLQARFGFNAVKAQIHREVVADARQKAVEEAKAAQAEAPKVSTPVVTTPVVPTYRAAAAAPTTRTSLGYTLPMTRNYSASSRYYSSSRSRYNYSYCPSCSCGGSSYYYVPVYSYPYSYGTSTSSGSLSVGR